MRKTSASRAWVCQGGPFPAEKERADATASIEGYPDAFLRVFRSEGIPDRPPWFWTVSDGHVQIESGHKDTAKEAARAAEEVWRRFVARRR